MALGLVRPLRPLFPNDITYTIGKSDYRKHWFFEQVPHELSGAWKNAAAKDPLQQRFGWVSTALPGEDLWRVIRRGKATTWTVRFNMDLPPRGQATLRVALAGADGGGGLAVAVNGHDVGTLYPARTSAIQYNTDKSVRQEAQAAFRRQIVERGRKRNAAYRSRRRSHHRRGLRLSAVGT